MMGEYVLNRTGFALIVACILLAWAAGCEPYAGPPRIVDDVSWKSDSFGPSTTTPAAKPTMTSTPVVRAGHRLSGRTIVVDPGHGGRDPGAGEVGFSPVPEKTIVLQIARDVERLLKAEGANVVMTRRDDRFVELLERAAIAERTRADLLVSIHADSHHDSSISGPTIYIAKGASARSRRAAYGVRAAFRDAGIQIRGIRSAEFKVLMEHNRPSILVESGYLTNGHEARSLNSNWYRRKIATCIVNGITRSMGG